VSETKSRPALPPPGSVVTPAWIERPRREETGVAVLLPHVLREIPPGSTVLDLGSGPGSFDYAAHPAWRILATDILPLVPPEPRPPQAHWFRADAARLPLASASVDVVIAHYVLEHVTDLEHTLDETARVVKPGGVVYCAQPRAAAFDDKFYRFAGYVAKYLLGKWKKRIEHQQRFSFESLNREFYRRGFVLEGFSVVPAGFSWLNDPRTQPHQAAFVGLVGRVKRWTGLDGFKDANFVCRYRRVDRSGYQRVTHVCRRCGEHAVLSPPRPAPARWTCPWCGLANELFLSPAERRRRP
jgi:SAM-dependent methyltransferase